MAVSSVFDLRDFEFPITDGGFDINGFTWDEEARILGDLDAEITTIGILRARVQNPRSEGKFNVRAGEYLRRLNPGSKVPSRTRGLACRVGGRVTYRASSGTAEQTFLINAGAILRTSVCAIDWDRTTASVEAVIQPGSNNSC